jgi:large subunit ribosomal protein L10Ae
MRICFIADEKHADAAKAANIEHFDVVSMEFLKKFNKDKKLIKNWAKKYSVLLATDSLVKKIPAVLGPVLNRIGMFPAPVTKAEPIANKVSAVRSSVKWQLKKVTNLNVAIGHQEMTDEQLRQNIVMSLNFLASLMKKQWHNMKSINIKMTMGPAVKLL